MLPNFAGSDYLSKRVLTGAEVTEGGNGYVQARVFTRLFAAIGQPSDAFEGASAIGSPMSLLAFSVHGADAAATADAFVDAILSEVPGGTVTRAKVGGRDGRRIEWLNGSTDSSFVFVIDDIVLVAGAKAANEAVVDDVIATLFAPKLEALLPATLEGRPTLRYSFPGASVGETGDMCSMVCPGEPHRFAKELGVDVERVDLAVAYLEQPPGIAIVAMRVGGVAADRLVEARINSSGRSPNPFFARQQLTIGGKSVTWVRVGPFDSALDVELLYAKDDVLYIVRPAPLSGEAPDPIVEEAFRALP
jgi:hypothetical protein